MGNRFAGVSDSVGADVMINWRGAAHTPEYDADGHLPSVEHCDGTKVVTPLWANYITKEYDVVDNCDDRNALFERSPAPPIHVRTFLRAGLNQSRCAFHLW